MSKELPAWMRKDDKLFKRMEYLRKKFGDKIKVNPMTNTPVLGRWYLHKVKQGNGRSRYVHSPFPKEEAFKWSGKKVITKYGIGDGKGTTITLKLVNTMFDPETGRMAGIYQQIGGPAFARMNIREDMMANELTMEETNDYGEYHEYHSSLRLMDMAERYKEDADETKLRLEKWKDNKMDWAGQIAGTIIETYRSGARDVAEYMISKESRFSFANMKRLLKDNWKITIIGLAVIALFAYFIFGGG